MSKYECQEQYLDVFLPVKDLCHLILSYDLDFEVYQLICKWKDKSVWPDPYFRPMVTERFWDTYMFSVVGTWCFHRIRMIMSSYAYVNNYIHLHNGYSRFVIDLVESEETVILRICEILLRYSYDILEHLSISFCIVSDPTTVNVHFLFEPV